MDLPYNAYAFKLDRVAGNGMQDKCILYKARGSVVNLADAVPGTTWCPVPTPIALDPSLVRVYKKEEKSEEKKEEDGEGAEESAIASAADASVDTTEALDNCAKESLADMESTEPSPAAGVDKLPSPEHQQQKKKTKNKSSEEHDHDDEIEDAADTYFTSSSASGANEVVRGMDPTVSVEVPQGSEVPALCIELVGNRFLRRMVRILTVRSNHFA